MVRSLQSMCAMAPASLRSELVIEPVGFLLVIMSCCTSCGKGAHHKKGSFDPLWLSRGTPTQHVRTPTTHSTKVVKVLEVLFQLTLSWRRGNSAGSCNPPLCYHSLTCYFYACLAITVLALLVSVTLVTVDWV
jgi:hypothetical protein